MAPIAAAVAGLIALPMLAGFYSCLDAPLARQSLRKDRTSCCRRCQEIGFRMGKNAGVLDGTGLWRQRNDSAWLRVTSGSWLR
jgi:hypothetical protein